MMRSDISIPGHFAGGSNDLRTLLERIAGTGPLDIQSARMMIEPYAAATAASNATVADLGAIRDTHEAACAATEMERFERLDGEFHKQIFAATRNDLLVCVHEIVNVIRGQSAWVDIKRRSFSEARRREYCRHHQNIVEALHSRNAHAASEAMRLHLGAVSNALFDRASISLPSFPQ